MSDSCGIQCRIQDYAVIGDCRSAALVSRGGSIDWLCWPAFDSPSIFGALLDPGAGRFRLAPVGRFHAERRYVEGTNVLETRFTTATGSVLLTDLMTVASEEEKRRCLLPDHQLLRQVEGLGGEVELELYLEPRPGFALGAPVRFRQGPLGVRCELGATALVLRTDLGGVSTGSGVARARGTIRAGEVRQASLTFDDDLPAVLQPPGDGLRLAIERTVRWWRSWLAQLRYEGPHREAVQRSALTLKLLCFAPSGAFVAAPTTSLPERPGGDLNWDYRYCWLRDAALTMRGLLGLGFLPEAEAFLSWLLHSTRLSRPELRVLYDVYGRPPAPEQLLGHLSGFDGSRPVRIGNAAAGQLQLDLYGEVIDAAAQLCRAGARLDRDTRRMLVQFGEQVCKSWQQPDEGIWEPRDGRAHHTHSRLLCWTALERLLELHEHGKLPRAPVALFSRHRAAIRRELEERGFDRRSGSYVATLDGDEVDASLLLLSWYGFEEARCVRMRGTYRRIRRELGGPHGLLHRYRQGFSPGEGAFGICGFWGVEYLAKGGGTLEEALAAFEELVSLGNDVGLFAEELDPATLDALGNFPQAFTHVGLIGAALALERRLGDEVPAEARRQETEVRPWA